MVAPVCHDSRDQVITQPAPKKLPAIPVATDLASALAAIAALTTIVRSLTQPPVQNNYGGVGGGGEPSKPQRWTQDKRVTETVKITNPDDPSQFVEIQRIKSLTMKDGQTGETWVWNR
jgi:hypothetical protein